jgi:SAM-dependent methyltransferase
MSKELDYITQKYDLDVSAKSPITFMLSREGLAQLFAELEYKAGAEIGIAIGTYSEILCKANPSMRLFSIDPWAVYDGYNEIKNRNKAESWYSEAQERLVPYNCELIRKFSMDAVKSFPDPNGSLDFVYIDGNHDFKNVACDISEWSKVVRSGGIVAGHDFKRFASKNRRYVCHVKDVVLAYTYSHGIRPWFIIRSKSTPSWFWVRE